MKRHTDRSSHSNPDRWLLTYADLITLLLGLFVILYAMSKIDAGKYSDLVSAMGGVFGTPQEVLTGGGTLRTPHFTKGEADRQQLTKDLRRALGTEKKNSAVSISETERGVTVHIMEELLFASGSAQIQQRSLPTMDSLASVIKALSNDLRVEGHTDNVPIATAQFPSNWHLSVARALTIGYYLIERHGLNQEKISIVGYSEYRPLVANDTPENRARNRRVDIVIVAPRGQPTDEHESVGGKGMDRQGTRTVL